MEKQLKKDETIKAEEQPMGDVYDVYAKASGVHSKISGMTEDYTLTRYNIDIYSQTLPKFIREQRKVLRIIKSYLLTPKETLKQFYNNDKKAEQVRKQLEREYNIIEELFLGELDECVIMGRTANGQVINAFLAHGMNPEQKEQYDIENEQPTIQSKLKERTRQ